MTTWYVLAIIATAIAGACIGVVLVYAFLAWWER